uniref:Uncharacterized protein n=1 Tax=Neobodo designis TaxID=312471 RepID=A0A7S1LYY6_NEODS
MRTSRRRSVARRAPHRPWMKTSFKPAEWRMLQDTLSLTPEDEEILSSCLRIARFGRWEAGAEGVSRQTCLGFMRWFVEAHPMNPLIRFRGCERDGRTTALLDDA